VAARSPEISLTSWLDPALEYFAKQAGIPVDQYSAQVGGEGIGTAFEVLADLFTKGWLNKGLQAATGILADLYAIFGTDVPVRLRRELLAIGTHELLRVVDMKPSDAIELADSIREAVEAIRRGDFAGFIASGLRRPAEVQTLITALTGIGAPARSLGRPSTTPPSYTPPAYSPPTLPLTPSTARTKTPAPTPSKEETVDVFLKV